MDILLHLSYLIIRSQIFLYEKSNAHDKWDCFFFEYIFEETPDKQSLHAVWTVYCGTHTLLEDFRCPLHVDSYEEDLLSSKCPAGGRGRVVGCNSVAPFFYTNPYT